MCADTLPPQASSIPAVNVVKYAFMSYKQEDKERVLPVVNGLRASGIAVWWDEDIPTGANWREEIETKLHDARCVVVVEHSLSWPERSVRS